MHNMRTKMILKYTTVDKGKVTVITDVYFDVSVILSKMKRTKNNKTFTKFLFSRNTFRFPRNVIASLSVAGIYCKLRNCKVH